LDLRGRQTFTIGEIISESVMRAGDQARDDCAAIARKAEIAQLGLRG